MGDKLTTHYRGYRLVNIGSRVEMYRNRAFVTWALSMAQAMRLVDEMIINLGVVK